MTVVLETAWEHIEDLKKRREYVTVSRWHTTRPLVLWALPFNEQSLTKNKTFEKISKNFIEAYKGRLDFDDTMDAFKLFSDAFVSKHNKKVYYRITSAFYNFLLFYESTSSVKCDGLLYGSANTEGAGMNIVLKKELIDNGTLFLRLCFYAFHSEASRSCKRLKDNGSL